jgi:hypothetical protein
LALFLLKFSENISRYLYHWYLLEFDDLVR